MMGTKENCLEAECGVCTVLLDGKSVNSCILLAAQAAGRSVTTIEGIGDPGASASAAGRVHRMRRRSMRILHSRA